VPTRKAKPCRPCPGHLLCMKATCFSSTAVHSQGHRGQLHRDCTGTAQGEGQARLPRWRRLGPVSTWRRTDPQPGDCLYPPRGGHLFPPPSLPPSLSLSLSLSLALPPSQNQRKPIYWFIKKGTSKDTVTEEVHGGGARSLRSLCGATSRDPHVYRCPNAPYPVFWGFDGDFIARSRQMHTQQDAGGSRL
jgi:hypothetical protein